MFTNKKGFTLIELLVVVLIIGILAAIAVPQYQVAVEKSRYSTLKNKTRAIAEAVHRYNLATGTYPKEVGELDISLPDIESAPRSTDEMHVYVDFKDGSSCVIWIDSAHMVMCSLPNDKMRFYFEHDTLQPQRCYSDKNYDTGNKVCQQETGKTKEQAQYCTDDYNYCTYFYN